MPWWERVLVFFRLRQRPYYTIMIPGNDGWSTWPVVGTSAIYMATGVIKPGNDGWSTWPVVGTSAIYMATGVIKPESGAVTPLWKAPIRVDGM